MKPKAVLCLASLTLATSAAPALSADTSQNTMGRAQTTSEQRNDVKQLLSELVNVVNTMKKDPKLATLLHQAKGVYVVPEFGRAAFVIGGRGGAGVMLAHVNGKWSNPGFYDFGAISLGPQIGASGGSVAFLLMNDRAVKNFMSGNVFSLNAGAGLSIIAYSANALASLGKGDIIFWSNTAGAYAGLTVSVSDINWDEANNNAFYNKRVTESDVFNGGIVSTEADTLKNALPG